MWVVVSSLVNGIDETQSSNICMCEIKESYAKAESAHKPKTYFFGYDDGMTGTLEL